jgi:hypothetical protein
MQWHKIRKSVSDLKAQQDAAGEEHAFGLLLVTNCPPSKNANGTGGS